MRSQSDKAAAAVVIKIDQEIIFNDFVEINQISDIFFKNTNIFISEIAAIGLEVKLLGAEIVEFTSFRNGIEYNLTANPKIGDRLLYRHLPQIKDPNCYFEILVYGETCYGSTKDTRSIKVDGDDDKLVIDAISKLKVFFNNDHIEYNEEFDFAKDVDPHSDGSFTLTYKFYSYIKYNSYGKVFTADIDKFIGGDKIKTCLIQHIENDLNKLIQDKDEKFVPVLSFLISHIKCKYSDKPHDNTDVINFINSFIDELQQNLDEMESYNIFDDSETIKSEINFLKQYTMI